MYNNPINPFEYVSILISIILGLGITQLLSAFSDLLYHYRKVKFYWPHTIWLVFILFLNIQDWFITFKLKDKMEWNLPALLFVLLYPIALFVITKMILPTNESEERYNMRSFYFSQYNITFLMMAVSALLSLLFNVFLLNKNYIEQLPLVMLFIAMLLISYKKINSEMVHKIVAITIGMGALISVIVAQKDWLIK
jgi:MFS family permease